MKIDIKKATRKIKNEAFSPKESTFRKAISISFGSFMAFTPIWGFQMIACLPFIFLFRLNKILVLIFVNISIAPLLPLIVYSSFKVGAYFIKPEETELIDWRNYSLETIQSNVLQYSIGSLIIAILIGVTAFIISYLSISLINRK